MDQNNPLYQPTVANSLSLANIEYINLVIQEEMETGIELLPDVHYGSVYEFMSWLAVNVKLHTLFVPRVLETIVDKIVEDVIVTDFVLSLADSVSLRLMVDTLPLNSIETWVASSVMCNRDYNPVNRLLPTEIDDVISGTFEEIFELLLDNRWLLVLIIAKPIFAKALAAEQKD